MKTLLISFIIWTFVLPCIVAICLILAFASAFMPNLFLVLTGLVIAFATLAIMRVLLWTPHSSKEDSASLSTTHTGR
jgi:hypothetical protein